MMAVVLESLMTVVGIKFIHGGDFFLLIFC